MSLLAEIQEAVLQEGSALAPILLKVRLLAAKLGSNPLEEWVKHESEGYPKDAPVPEYRRVHVSYVGNFHGPYGRSVQNAPIPAYLIEKFASKHWTTRDVRESISAIDDLLSGSEKSGEFYLEASNLMLVLQGKVYPDMVPSSVSGKVPRGSMIEIQHAVRSRVLELTVNLEKAIPDSATVTISTRGPPLPITSEKATQITNQVIYGNVTTISSSGAGAVINIAVQPGDHASLIEALVSAGIPHDDAAEFGQIIAAEKPVSKDNPFGTKTQKWIVENMKKVGSGAWKIGVDVVTEVLKEAALKFAGLK